MLVFLICSHHRHGRRGMLVRLNTFSIGMQCDIWPAIFTVS